MALLKKANTYYAYFRDIDGRQVKRSLHTGDLDIAKAREKVMKEAIKGVKFRAAVNKFYPEREQITTAFPKKEIPQGEHHRGSIALDKMWDVAITRCELSYTHKIHWRSFINRIGVKYADEVTPAKALQYLETHYSKGNGKTFNNVKSDLNTVFRFCLIEAGLTDSPFKPIADRRVKKAKSKPWRNLTLDEFDTALKNAPAEYMRIMMMLSRWTTQRLETCARMTPEMFDFERLAFIIDPGKLKRFDKWVCCPILPELEKFIKPILARCKDSTTPIVKNFDYPGNKKMSEHFTAHLRKNNISNTECARVGFHSLRGTAITWYKENGVQGEELRSITGHSSLKMEDKYARAVSNISRIAKAWKKE